jgi:hypothetical protein
MSFRSGGEPGVALAVCEFCRRYNLPLSGRCLPNGSNMDDINVSSIYGLKTLPDIRTEPPMDYRYVTIINTRESSHLLVIHIGETKDARGAFLHNLYEEKGFYGNLSWQIGFEEGKKRMLLDISNENEALKIFKEWFLSNDIESLCVTGPSDKEAPGIFKKTLDFLVKFGQDPETFGIPSQDEKVETLKKEEPKPSKPMGKKRKVETLKKEEPKPSKPMGKKGKVETLKKEKSKPSKPMGKKKNLTFND